MSPVSYWSKIASDGQTTRNLTKSLMVAAETEQEANSPRDGEKYEKTHKLSLIQNNCYHSKTRTRCFSHCIVPSTISAT